MKKIRFHFIRVNLNGEELLEKNTFFFTKSRPSWNLYGIEFYLFGYQLGFQISVSDY